MLLTLDSARRLEPVPRPGLPSLRRRRIAATALFTVDGLVFGTWASRIPNVAAQTGAGPTALGLALLCVSIGALASMQLTGTLCSRLGPGPVSVGAAIATCAALALPGLSASVPELAVYLLVFGAATGTLNVAANAVGVRVERAADRPVLPSLHAGFSLGGLVGAATGGLVAGVAPPATHLLVVGLAGMLVTAAVTPTLLAGERDQVGGSAGPKPIGGLRGTLVLLGVMAGCTAFGEGAVTDWGALHLREMGASPALAAAGYAGFSLAMACGRLAGNGLLRTFGPTRVVAGGALLAAAGGLVVAIVPVPAMVLAGFVLIGLGLANVFPIAIARAGSLAGPAGVALASTVGYSGLLGGPPLLGIMAGAVGLNVAFVSVALLAAVAAGLAGILGPRTEPLLARHTALLRRVAGARSAGWGAEHTLGPAAARLRASAARAGSAAHRHGDSLSTLHAQLIEPRRAGRPYPVLGALAA